MKTTYKIMIERSADNRRFTRDFTATSEAEALKIAYRELVGETQDYYVIAIEPRIA